MSEEQKDFARAFGDALLTFLEGKRLTQSDAAKKLGLDEESGKQRLNSYFRKGKRPKPSAEILYLVCARLGFEFDYNGYKITAETVNGHRPQPIEAPPLQLPLEFNGKFDLTDQKGQKATVSVHFRRPTGAVEVSINLKAAS